MFSIFLSFMVFTIGYIFLIRRIDSCCKITSIDGGSVIINGNTQLDNAVFMVLIWGVAFFIFVVVLACLYLSLTLKCIILALLHIPLIILLVGMFFEDC